MVRSQHGHGLLCLVAALSLVLQGVGRKPDRQGRLLSEEPRVELVDGFVSARDVLAIRQLAAKLGFQSLDAGMSEVNGGEEFVVLNSSTSSSTAVSDEEGWAASQRFAAAAREWAGLRKAVAAPVVTRWESWSRSSHLNRSGLLHLDSRLKPHLRSTVLAYLGSSRRDLAGPLGSGAAEGGFTVFPCIETEDMDSKEAMRRQRLCSRAERHVRLAQAKLLAIHQQGMQLPPSRQLDFLKDHPELTALPKLSPRGLRPVNWQWTPEHDALAETSPGALRADPLFALAEAMCRGQAPGLRIAPKPGSALLLEVASRDSGAKSAQRELAPHWLLWHAGCSPLQGQGRRWTLQLFLEEPELEVEEAGWEGPEPTCQGAEAACAVDMDPPTPHKTAADAAS